MISKLENMFFFQGASCRWIMSNEVGAFYKTYKIEPEDCVEVHVRN
jgi:hypothetical protein